jgi:uncharacterized membrane protein YbaN (DUF454 family)
LQAHFFNLTSSIAVVPHDAQLSMVSAAAACVLLIFFCLSKSSFQQHRWEHQVRCQGAKLVLWFAGGSEQARQKKLLSLLLFGVERSVLLFCSGGVMSRNDTQGI